MKNDDLKFFIKPLLKVFQRKIPDEKKLRGGKGKVACREPLKKPGGATRVVP